MKPGVCLAWLLATALLCDSKPHHKKSLNKSPAFRDEYDLPWMPEEDQTKVKDKDEVKAVDDKWMAWNPPKPDNSPVVPDVKKAYREEEEMILPKFEDPCKNVFCHFGRVCKETLDGRGECVCAGEDFCAHHSRRVCGTDGVYYPSHCELHRMACVKNMHIGIDHGEHGCKTEEQLKEELKGSYDSQKTDGEKAENEETPKVLVTVEKPEDQEKVEEKKEEQKQEESTPSTTLPPIRVVKLEHECSDVEFTRMKNALLLYHCARIGETDCTDDHSRKQFVATVMFNYYDRDSDQALTAEELEDVEHRDHLERLSRFCSLTNMMTFDDKEEDGNISISEFYTAFKVPSVVLDENLKTFTTVVTEGTSLEIKCDIHGATKIIWKRNGNTLDEITTDDIKVFEDGSLYIRNLALHHMGNYTCQDRKHDHIVQTHILKVQTSPTVRVNPSTQFHTSGSTVTLKCHVDGVPEPDITWEMNEVPLTVDDEDRGHFSLLHSNTTLQIEKAMYTRDTGAYKCKATNNAGSSQDIATIFIENSNVPKYGDAEELYEVFVVFHDKGYTIYEPSHCHVEHQVTGDFHSFKHLPEYTQYISRPPTLCGQELSTQQVANGEEQQSDVCSWGHAVNVRNKYIYISQPELHRVVVIEIQDRSNPVEIIQTDKYPVKVQYVEHLDQVWVLCWNSDEDSGSKTVVVIRQASEDLQHHTVHTQPIGNRFDLVRDIVLPPNNDLHQKFQYGYVLHSEQQALYKVDLEAMEYVKNIDLGSYDCVPQSLVFLPLGGNIVVHCHAPLGQPLKSTRLVLDYVTDKVLHQSALSGEPYVTPDLRHMVTIEGDSNTVSVYKVTDEGKTEHMFDEYTSLHIADVTFFPSERGRGYDLYASSANKNEVLFINLASGKVEMIEGVGEAMNPSEWRWSKHNRVISSGGVFGEYLMTPSKDSVVVLDGRRRHIQCEWQNIAHGNVIVWVEPIKL